MEEKLIEDDIVSSGASGKNKIASSASGCTRRTRRFGRNLLTPDAACHGTVRPTQLAKPPCVRTRNTAAYAYRTRSVSAFSFWTQPCQGIFLLDAAVSSGRSRVIWTQPCLLDTALSSGRNAWLLDAARGFMACGRTLHIGDIVVTVPV
jgi:hypothetical protein